MLSWLPPDTCLTNNAAITTNKIIHSKNIMQPQMNYHYVHGNYTMGLSNIETTIFNLQY